MGVFAITTILRGEDGDVKEIKVGDELSGFSDDEVRALIDGGSAVETGKNRKYTAEPAPGAPSDEETRKRDELLAKAAMSSESDDPTVAASGGSPAAQAGGTKTIAQAGADAQRGNG